MDRTLIGSETTSHLQGRDIGVAMCDAIAAHVFAVLDRLLLVFAAASFLVSVLFPSLFVILESRNGPR
jgi:hypothetical protein